MTRLVVFSDTHGNIEGIQTAMDAVDNVSGIVHLGDGVMDGKRVADEKGLPFWGVCGNEDYGDDSPESLLIRSDHWPIMLIHGHQWEINPYQSRQEWDANMEQMADIANKAGARCLLFGHTHRSYYEEKERVLLCNPGHLYIGAVEDHSFAIVETDEQYLKCQIIENNK